jgi:hypothetical protein
VNNITFNGMKIKMTHSFVETIEIRRQKDLYVYSNSHSTLRSKLKIIKDKITSHRAQAWWYTPVILAT